MTSHFRYLGEQRSRCLLIVTSAEITGRGETVSATICGEPLLLRSFVRLLGFLFVDEDSYTMSLKLAILATLMCCAFEVNALTFAYSYNTTHSLMF